MTKTRGLYSGGIFLLLGLMALTGMRGAAQESKKLVSKTKLQYNKDIRPILSENCFACHGPDSAARKAGLRLDKFADAVKSKAIVPGNPSASSIIGRVNQAADSPILMPPATTHKILTPEQKQKLTDWITQGAEYQQHWSYIAPKMSTIPTLSAEGKAWVRNPIDAFVFQKLAESNLKPAPEADRYTLARRVSLDLTGLPPRVADVEAFVQDKSPDAIAYEKFIDKYLAKPQWGEHRGRYWLDAARYGDTHGIHIDNFREIWSYRDWVIKAFNKNMPFQEFVTEQLAGDLLPNPTLDQRIATGFNRCNITTSEGGAIDEEYYVLYARDRTDTMAQVFMGTTAGCAVCHDHKFDPLSQREFYSLAAFFNNTTQAAMDGNIQNTPPTIPVPLEEDRPRFEALQTELTEAKKATETRKVTAQADFEKWLAAPQTTATLTIPTDDQVFYAPLDGKYPEGATVTGTAAWQEGVIADQAYVRKNGATASFAEAGDFDSDKPFSASAWVKLPANAGGAVFARMDEGSDYRGWDLWVEGMKFASHLINKWPENALKVVTNESFEANRWYHVALTYDGKKNRDSLRFYVDGRQRATTPATDALTGTSRTPTPFRLGQRSGGAAMEGVGLQDVRLYDRQLAPEELMPFIQTRTQYLLTKSPEKRTPAQKTELFNGWITTGDTQYVSLLAKQTALQNEDAQIRARGTIAHVSNEKKEEAMAYILMRGEYTKRGDKVTPITPAALPAMGKNLPKNRLGLAKWLLQPSHPLTYRVTVNRFWQEIFGQGLVRTTGDFGIAGELPSHPELLDWLALDFQKDGNIKRFYKQILMSATYRQAGITTAEKRQRDPSNRLLSRGPRFRMDAEMVRDYALASSGLLVKKLGGPSVKPYQPAGIWEAVTMPGSNTRDYKRDSGESLYRRSLYTFWKRSAPPASLEIFNAPTREVCTVRRERTNTPLQALATMNDEQYVEAARNLAQTAILYNKDRFTRARYIAERLLLRPITDKEKILIDLSLGDLEEYYNAHIPDAQQLVSVGESRYDTSIHPSELAAYTMLTNQLLNLDEVLNK